MTRLDRTNGVHHVYRCYDDAGRLVYVGSSANLFGRLTQHRRTSWWAGQVASVTAKVYPTGTIAREHERAAIRSEHPRWNKAGRWVTRHEWTQDQWDDWLTMLLGRKTFAAEMRRFVGLYRRRWGVEPDAVMVAAVVAAEEDYERDREEMRQRHAEHAARAAEVQREDELQLRRSRKAARDKAKRLTKKAKRAQALVREFDEVIES